MATSRARGLKSAAFVVGIFVGCSVAPLGQAAVQPAPRTAPAEPPGQPDIIVRGRGYGELRLRIKLAEEAVFARFNEINSTDDFDIHCREETRAGSRILFRSCLSNSWREQNANIAQALLRPGIPPEFYIAQQQLMQRRLGEEARRLALEDAQLAEAVLSLGQARFALARRTDQEHRLTAWRQVSASADGLPYEAAQMFEVRVGEETWDHLLTERTFAFASVTGTIRSLKVDCREEDENLDYELDAEWTLPEDWTACILIVRAKKGTTFALLEF